MTGGTFVQALAKNSNGMKFYRYVQFWRRFTNPVQLDGPVTE